MFRFRLRTIRTRLLVGFVLMALLAALGTSVASVVLGYINGRQQAIDRLQSVAALKELELSVWSDVLQNELLVALNEQYASERASIVLELANAHKHYEFYFKAMQNRLKLLVSQSQLLEDIALLNLEGRVVLATDPPLQVGSCAGYAVFEKGKEDTFIQLPFPPVGSEPMSGAVCGMNNLERDGRHALIARPVFTQEGDRVGVIVGHASLDPLIASLTDRASLGRTGKVFLLDPGGGALLGAAKEGDLFSGRTTLPYAVRVGEPGVYDDYRDIRVVGVYRHLAGVNLLLAVEQDLSETFGVIWTSLTVNGSIALIVMILAVGASYFITRSIIDPLVSLVDTTARIAGGDLDRAAPVRRDDEVGALSIAFNSMTAQLRDLINHLEQRVAERTRDLQNANLALQRRALQLETSAEVSREVTSILNIDALLSRVAELIRDAFGYYHVHIYFTDRDAQLLLLRSSTAEGDLFPQCLEVGGASLNGLAATTGQSVLANDVAQDPRFLPDDHLYETRSELVVPLRVGERVIGTLDVQSSRLNAFTPEDVLVIQSLGDQIAVAIENARLYEHSRELAVIEERNRLARDLHDSVIQALYSLNLLAEGWRRLVKVDENATIDHFFDRVSEVSHQALKEMRLLVHELRPPTLEKEGLLGALQRRLEAVEDRTGVRTRLRAHDFHRLPSGVEEGLYRVAQEALNNTLKHSGATQVSVEIKSQGEYVALEVNDNGCGFELNLGDSHGGMGLRGMLERTQKMGGKLSVVSAPGQGTTVTAVVLADAPVTHPFSFAPA